MSDNPPEPSLRVSYSCGCRPARAAGIWSDRCRVCTGLRMRRNLNREDWGRCVTCRRVTLGMIDARRCRRCWPLACHPERR